MSKGLEAFERIQCNYVHVFKARENGKTQLVHDLNTIKKEIKALEIIKEKQVDIVGVLIYAFKEKKGCEFYNSYTSKEEHKLTQEEYDLLKEVLL